MNDIRIDRGIARTLLVLLAVVVALAAPAPGHSETQGRARIGSVDGTARWTGSFENVAVPAPELCAAGACDTFTLDLALPRGTFNRRPGGLQVAIRWDRFASHLSDARLDLYVYGPGGTLLAAGAGEASMAEAVRIENPRNGRYTVVVLPWLVGERLRYSGFVEIELSARARPVRALLPNLVAVKPDVVTLKAGTAGPGFLADPHGVPGNPSSCYPHEIAAGATRCLRFDQAVQNVGPGAWELRAGWDAVGPDEHIPMVQRIFRSDGSFVDRPSGSVVWHTPHGHFHYDGFIVSRLYRARTDGTPGAMVAGGRKSGFCALDVRYAWFGARYKGDQPRTYEYPGVCDPAYDEQTFLRLGISVGWEDIYPWWLGDQYIDIAGLPDGSYVLEVEVDAGDSILETRDDDNVSRTLIRIVGDQVRVV